MSRSRAAWLAGAVAVLLAAAYLLNRRQRTPALAAAVTPPAPASAVRVPAAPEPAAPEPRSWDGGPGSGHRVAMPEPTRDDDHELPLPTWVRLSIVGLALLAFFAVSLIATKQV